MRKKNNCTAKETDECLIDGAKVGRKKYPRRIFIHRGKVA